jgi:hypothetical protein
VAADQQHVEDLRRKGGLVFVDSFLIVVRYCLSCSKLLLFGFDLCGLMHSSLYSFRNDA